MSFLPEFTFVLNYAAFIIVLWLGLYIILHNPTYPLSWLTALTLWSLAMLFFHFLLEPTFLPTDPFDLSRNSWFQGLAVIPALAFWHHATMLMRPKRLNWWRLTRILVAYLLAFSGVLLKDRIWSTPNPGNTGLNTRQAGPLYPFFIAAFLVFSLASMINLVRSARATPSSILRKQLLILASATLIAGLTGPALLVGTLFKLPIPITVISFLLAVTIGIIGYGVARYSALMEGRTIHRDFFYNLIMVGLISAIYIPVCWTLMRIYRTPAMIFILIPVLAVFTHSLINPAYRLIDRLLLRRETSKMRAGLFRLARLAFEGDAFTENIGRRLETLCYSVHATYGVVLVFENNSTRMVADYRWHADKIELQADIFKSDDAAHLTLGQLPKPFDEAALLDPLYQENDQFGALVLGHPVNGLRYAEEDMERILNPADRIGEVILNNRLITRQIDQVTQFTQPGSSAVERLIPVEMMENALRNLFDYTYLADSPLSQLGLVQAHLPHGPITHLDRGKAVHQLLREGLEKFNPGTAVPHDPPPREWYPYLILKSAYLDGVSNRDIMMKLYISEGTFNRTRRAAVRSMARALEELEAAIQ
jgi:hypothetical protein